ncbi:MAG: TonB-dependent receptor [Bacteroidetes bacterium]|nr:MAG: TonB-dependent receptor [Bacteroidota bacterium]
MKRYWWLILFLSLLPTLVAWSQRVSVLDETSGHPLKDVAVFSYETTFSSLTDYTGTVDLTDYKGEVLTFQHTGYYPQRLSIAQIKAGKYTVLLTPRVIRLDPFIISANKWEQPAEEVPAKITTIDRAQIRRYNPQTAADLLGQSQEVFIQKSQLGGGSPMIRGFSTNTVLLVFDGIRLNNAIYRTGNVQNAINIDPFVLEGAEIIFGPGSVIYGSDALGGVMDFHILPPSYDTTKQATLSGNALMRYHSANNEKTAHADVSITGKTIHSYTSISFSDFDHLQMGFKGNHNDQYLRRWYVQQVDGKDSIFTNEDPNTQIESAYKQYHITQKLHWKPVKEAEFSYLFYYSGTSNLPRYDQLRVIKKGKPKFATWYYGPQNLMINALTAKLSKPMIAYNRAKITASIQQYKESRHYRKFNERHELSQKERVGIFTLNMDFEKTLTQNTEAIYGAEALYNHLQSTASQTALNGTPSQGFVPPRYPDGANHWSSAALYTALKHKHKNVIFNVGIRYSYIVLHSTFKDPFYQETFGYRELRNNNGAFNGSLGITWKACKNTILYGSASSGFHAPNWDGLAKVFTPKKGVVIVPNNQLKPEYAYNGETGITQHLFNQKATLEANLYYTYLDKAIVQRAFSLNGESQLVLHGDTNRIEAFVNTGYAHLYGFNISLQADITPYLGIKSRLSYTYGRDAEHLPLRHVPPLFGGTHLIFRHKKLSTSLYAVYNGAIKAANLAPSEQGKDHMYALDQAGNLWAPSWYTLNLNVQWNPSERFSLSGTVENILDARYRPYGSGICAAGRSASVSIQLHF